jgi:hypothetical protein
LADQVKDLAIVLSKHAAAISLQKRVPAVLSGADTRMPTVLAAAAVLNVSQIWVPIDTLPYIEMLLPCRPPRYNPSRRETCQNELFMEGISGDAFIFGGLVGFVRHSPSNKKAAPFGAASFCNADETATRAHLAVFGVAGVLRFAGVLVLAAFAGCLAVFAFGPFAGVLRFVNVLALAAFAGLFVVFAILITSIRLLNVRMRIDVNHKE